MKERMDYGSASPAAMKAMLAMEAAVKAGSLERPLIELVKLRASQINGCAYCIDMHTKDARALGESEMRLYCLSVWREAPFYTDRERAALAWTEAVTLVSESYVPDDVFELARTQFSETELADLTLAVVLINGWNRFCISFRDVPGNYESKLKPLTTA